MDNKITRNEELFFTETDSIPLHIKKLDGLLFHNNLDGFANEYKGKYGIYLPKHDAFLAMAEYVNAGIRCPLIFDSEFSAREYISDGKTPNPLIHTIVFSMEVKTFDISNNKTCSNCENHTKDGYCRFLHSYNTDERSYSEVHVKTPDDFACNQWKEKEPIVCYEAVPFPVLGELLPVWEFCEKTIMLDGVYIGTKNGLPVYLGAMSKALLD